MNTLGIGEHLFTAPLQTILFLRIQVRVSSNNQDSLVSNLFNPKATHKFTGSFHVPEFPKPIDDLAVSLLELTRPYTSRSSALTLENAGWTGAFELDKAVTPMSRIADCQIRLEIAEEVILESKPIEIVQIKRI